VTPSSADHRRDLLCAPPVVSVAGDIRGDGDDAASTVDTTARLARRRSSSTTARDSYREHRLVRSRLGVPPPRHDQIQRAGLVNRLRVARSADVVTVTAPPGTERRRSSLIGLDATSVRSRGTALRRQMTAPLRRSLAAAVSSVTADSRAALRSVARSGRPEEVVAAIARALAQSESKVVVVLDDVDSSRSGGDRALQLFVGRAPCECQLVLVARASRRSAGSSSRKPKFSPSSASMTSG